MADAAIHGHDHDTRGFFTRWFMSTNHKDIGILYLFTGGLVGLISVIFTVYMRMELMHPGVQYMCVEGLRLMADAAATCTPNGHIWNVTITAHGILMMFFVVIPALFGGFGNYFMPLQIGAPDMAFPRMNNLSYWLYVAGTSLAVASLFAPGGGGELGPGGHLAVLGNQAVAQRHHRAALEADALALGAGQLLQDQAGGALGLAGQQHAGGQLFALLEVALEGFGQAVGVQAHQALVAGELLGAGRGGFDGDRQHRTLAEGARAQRGGHGFFEMGDAAHGVLGGALGEQRAQGAGAAQLHAQPAVDLGVAGEQRRRGAGFAQARGHLGRVVGAAGDLLPGLVQVHDDAAHAGAFKQEAGKGVGVGVFVHACYFNCPRSETWPRP